MKKESQLGMNPSTASHRLVKDLLFMFVRQHHPNCHKCGLPLTRETFSIEHITPWLDSADPVSLYFDLENIAFSHHSCNVGSARKVRSDHGSQNRYNTGCRCESCKAAKAERMKKEYTTEGRRERYKKYGC